MFDSNVWAVEKACRVGHENIRKFIMNPQEWAEYNEKKRKNQKNQKEQKKKDLQPYKPQIGKVLDWEAYYWFKKKEEEAALVFREDPAAPLPSNPLVAVRAVLPADEQEAERVIARIEALVRADDPAPVNPSRFGELLRLWDRQSREASVEYPRKRARRKPKDDEDDGRTKDGK